MAGQARTGKVGDTILLPSGNRGVFGVVFAPYRRHPLEVLRRGRRRRRGEIVARYPCLLEEPFETRRGDEQQRPGRLTRHVRPPSPRGPRAGEEEAERRDRCPVSLPPRRTLRNPPG